MKFTDYINEKNVKHTINEVNSSKFSNVSTNYDKIIQDLSNSKFSLKWVFKAFERDSEGE